jgi:hypothetical protein
LRIVRYHTRRSLDVLSRTARCHTFPLLLPSLSTRFSLGADAQQHVDAGGLVTRHPLHDAPQHAPRPLHISNAANQPSPSLEEVFTGGWLQREQMKELYKQLIQRERPFAVAVEKCVEDAVRRSPPALPTAPGSLSCRFHLSRRPGVR